MVSGYPLDFGTYEKLNKKGKALASMNLIAECARYDMDDDSPDASWRTFRDCNPSKCCSIFTGTRAAPFKCPWLELESCKTTDIVDQIAGEEKWPAKVQTMAKSVVTKLRLGRV